MQQQEENENEIWKSNVTCMGFPVTMWHSRQLWILLRQQHRHVPFQLNSFPDSFWILFPLTNYLSNFFKCLLQFSEFIGIEHQFETYRIYWFWILLMAMMVGGVRCCDLWGVEPRRVWWGCEDSGVHTNSCDDDNFLVEETVNLEEKVLFFKDVKKSYV